ncbi:MAG: POTRA domain-containing protein, partial [Myxococcota bacterium]|nr:POTRA domain-containing protein [Myxococcota bacterium]
MILLLLLSIAFAAPWYVGQTVNQISIVSPSGSEGELSSLLGHPLGEPLDLRLVRQDLQTLYLAGDFDSVVVRVHPIMGEGVHLQYNIKHAPKINAVRFVGAPAELKNILTNRLNLNLGQVFYPEEEIFKLEESIRTIGAKEGWTDLQVRIDVLRNNEQRVNLTLNIEPGEVQKLSGITLVDLPQEVFIETQLLLLRKGIWRGARVSIKELSRLKDEIRTRLVRKGWIQARVNLPLVEVSAKRSQLTIRVEPGPLHLFEADSPLPKGEKLLALLDIYPGDRITVGDEERFEQKVYLWMQRNGFVGAPPKVSIQRTPKKITIDIE